MNLNVKRALLNECFEGFASALTSRKPDVTASSCPKWYPRILIALMEFILAGIVTQLLIGRGSKMRCLNHPIGKRQKEEPVRVVHYVKKPESLPHRTIVWTHVEEGFVGTLRSV